MFFFKKLRIKNKVIEIISFLDVSSNIFTNIRQLIIENFISENYICAFTFRLNKFSRAFTGRLKISLEKKYFIQPVSLNAVNDLKFTACLGLNFTTVWKFIRILCLFTEW